MTSHALWQTRFAKSRPIRTWIGELYFERLAEPLITSSRYGAAFRIDTSNAMTTDRHSTILTVETPKETNDLLSPYTHERMVAYIKQIADELAGLDPQSSVEVSDLIRSLSEELDRLDPRDFLPASRFDFVMIRTRARGVGSEKRIWRRSACQGVCQESLRVSRFLWQRWQSRRWPVFCFRDGRRASRYHRARLSRALADPASRWSVEKCGCNVRQHSGGDPLRPIDERFGDTSERSGKVQSTQKQRP